MSLALFVAVCNINEANTKVTKATPEVTKMQIRLQFCVFKVVKQQF